MKRPIAVERSQLRFLTWVGEKKERGRLTAGVEVLEVVQAAAGGGEHPDSDCLASRAGHAVDPARRARGQSVLAEIL